MSKRIDILKTIRNLLVSPSAQEKKMYYTIKEKKEMVLRGEDVPICIGDSNNNNNNNKLGIVPLRHVPNSKTKKMKFHL